METSGVCELDVGTRRIVGGNDSPPDLDSPSQVSVDGSSFVLLPVHVCSVTCGRFLCFPPSWTVRYRGAEPAQSEISVRELV